jgi:sensor histidine kinase YesM
MYPLLLIAPAAILIADMIFLIINRSTFSKIRFCSMLVFLITPFICTLIQMFSYGILAIVIGSSIAAFFLFVQLLLDQMNRFVESTKRQAHQQISIMTLQMRPHFIYNVMSSIYYLCDIDTQNAKSVIRDFNSYLQKNFSLIVKEGLVPFDDELEHAKAYLAVEKARYENSLYVEYDTDFQAFHIPPLTLQPIVENSVKHGVDPELDPLHITIRTEKRDESVIITVEDSGKGFDSSEPDLDTEPVNSDDEDRAHIGLRNIKYRLKAMCNGSLSITSRPTGGTVVTIMLPYDSH